MAVPEASRSSITPRPRGGQAMMHERMPLRRHSSSGATKRRISLDSAGYPVDSALATKSVFPRVTVLVAGLTVVSMGAMLVYTVWLGAACAWEPPAGRAWVYQWNPNIKVDEPVLMVDDGAISRADKLHRVMNPPTRDPEPVIKHGYNEMERSPYAFGTVLHQPGKAGEFVGNCTATGKPDDGVYKFWYQSGHQTDYYTPVLYAESCDGISWLRPNLGLFTGLGIDSVNAVRVSLRREGPLLSPSVVYDEADPDASRRYKMAAVDQRSDDIYTSGGIYLHTSPDGVHWTPIGNATLPAIRITEDGNSVSDVADLLQPYDGGRFVLYTKGWHRAPGGKAIHRLIVRTEGDDFQTWSAPRVVLEARHYSLVKPVYPGDARDTQSYGMPTFRYPGGLIIGLLRRYFKPGDYTIDIRLAVSRDGVNWNVVHAADAEGIHPAPCNWTDTQGSFFPVGPPGAWDDGMVFMPAPVMRQHQLEFWYGGWDGPHSSLTRQASIGRAVLPWDRFAYFTPTSDWRGGMLVTSPIVVPGARLSLNLDTSDGGYALVEVQPDDQDGADDRFAQLSFNTCDRIVGNTRYVTVTWQDADSGVSVATALAPAVGYRVRLRIWLSPGARLFAFTFHHD